MLPELLLVAYQQGGFVIGVEDQILPQREPDMRGAKSRKACCHVDNKLQLIRPGYQGHPAKARMVGRVYLEKLNVANRYRRCQSVPASR